MPGQIGRDPARRGPGLGRWLFWLSVALVARIYEALPPWIAHEGPTLPPGEGLYHLRRIREILRHFPEVPTFDPYLAFPDGGLIPGEPGFDLLVGYLVRFLGLGPTAGDPLAEALLWVSLLAVPLMGLLVLPVYATLAAQISSPRAVTFLLPILALTGVMVEPSRLGQLSARALEPLLFAAPLLPLLYATRGGRRPGAASNTISLGAAGGLLLGGSFFFWRGMTLCATVIALWLGGRALQRLRRGRLKGFDLWGGALVMGVAAAVAAPLCISHPMGRAGQVSALTLSWLQPLYLAGLGAGLGLLSLSIHLSHQILAIAARESAFVPPWLSTPGGRVRQGLRLILALGVGLTPLALLCAVSPSFRAALPQAPLPWLGPSSPLPLVPGHGRALFQALEGEWTLLTPLSLYGFAFVLWPVALLRLIRAPLRAHMLLLPAAILLGLAGVMDQRYAALFGPVYALVLALAMEWSGPRGGSTGLRGALLLLALVPAFPGVLTAPRPPPVDADLVQTLAWMAQRTPDPGGFKLGEGDAPPSYGVLAPGPLGLPIVALGRRPALCVASSAPWLAAACEGLPTRLDRADLAARMAESGARYLLLEAPSTLLPSAPPVSEGADAPKPADPTQMRLIYEAPGSAYQLFERVEGARVQGRWRPNHRVRLQIPIRTNEGRRFTWEGEARADALGRYELRVPYATQEPPAGWTWGLAQGELTGFGPAGQRSQSPVAIDGESVRLGWSIRGTLPLPSP